MPSCPPFFSRPVCHRSAVPVCWLPPRPLLVCQSGHLRCWWCPGASGQPWECPQSCKFRIGAGMSPRPHSVVIYGKLFSSLCCWPCCVGTVSVCVCVCGRSKERKGQMPDVWTLWRGPPSLPAALYLVIHGLLLNRSNPALMCACSLALPDNFTGPSKADTGFYFWGLPSTPHSTQAPSTTLGSRGKLDPQQEQS